MRKSLAALSVVVALGLGAYADLAQAWTHGVGSGGGGDVFLTDVTVTNPVASSQTNMPFSIGLPFAPGTIDASHHIKCVDNATSLEIPCQEDNQASDLTPTLRFEGLEGVFPSATASEVKALKVYVSAGAPTTGTDIAVSDITATSYDFPVAFTDINGVSGTWTASPLDALNSGNTGWVNKTTPTVMGMWRHGGGLATEYVLFVPAVNGGTADAQVHVIFDVLCFKAARTAVSGGNPIIGCRTDEINEDAYIQASAPVDNWYGLCVDVSCAVANFPNSTPSANLTLPSTGTSNNGAVAASAAIFTGNSLGYLIANGTGVATINGYTDTSDVKVNIYKAFGTTSLTSGGWKLYGVNHPYGARYEYRGWWGPSGAPNWPQVETHTAYIGDAFNDSTFAGGPGPYFKASKLIMNYNFAASIVTNAITCSAGNACLGNMGTNPMSYLNGGAQFGAGGFDGNLQLYLETSGERGDIGVMPDWDTAALVRYNTDAPTIIFGNAQRWTSFPVNWRDQNTGIVTSPCNAGTAPTCSGATNWDSNGSFSMGTAIKGPSNSISPWSTDAFAHDPEDFYVAYLLTGDFYWAESQNFSAFYATTNTDPSASGSGLARTVYSTNGTGMQERGRSWALRSITDFTLFNPDAGSSLLGWNKSAGTTLLNNEYGSTKGLIPLFVNDTGTGKTYATDGPRWTFLNNNAYAVFETGYGVFAMYHQLEQGMLNSDGLTALNWWVVNEVGVASNSNLNYIYAMREQYGSLYDVSSSCPGTAISDWTSVYQTTSGHSRPGSDSIGANPARWPNGTLTLSATSGSAVTATISGAGNWFNTTAFYPGMWIAPNSGNGLARIVSVTDPNTLIVDTTATHQYYNGNGCTTTTGQTFTNLTYAAGAYSVPMAAPTDPIGTDQTQYIGAKADDFAQIVQADTLLANEYGATGGAGAYSNAWTGFSTGVMIKNQTIKWVIQAR